LMQEFIVSSIALLDLLSIKMDYTPQYIRLTLSI
jgi:hypothetical protein